MKQFLANNKDSILLIFLMWILLYLFYGDVFLHPNNYLFSASGDGLKNYFTYNYFISNNHSWLNFEGMNYPYGEHFLYTDCTPILSLIMKSLLEFIPFVKGNEIGVLNSIIFLSYFLSAIFLFWLFKRLKVNVLFALLASIAYTFLSPQVFRMTGHLALSLNCFLPVSIYFLYRYELSRKLFKHSVFLSFLILFWLFVHAYLGIMVFMLFFCFYAMKFLISFFQTRKGVKAFLKISLFLFSPLLLFNLFVFITDTHSGRTNNPYGFFSYYTEMKSLFIPTHGELSRFILKLFPVGDRNWETLSYLGIVSILFLIVILVNSILTSIRKKRISFDERIQQEPFLIFLFLSSVCVLIFSMCIPFRFNLEFLLDYFKILKQFRALGRFSWVFFYVIAIMSVVFIDRLFKQYIAARSKFLNYTFVLCVPILVFYESIEYHQEAFQSIKTERNQFKMSQLDIDIKKAINKIEAEKYQSIVPLPYYYIGSENYLKIPVENKIYQIAKLISFHSKLPLMSSFLTRTSIWESKSLMQLFSSPFYKKEIKKDIKSNKPFLFVVSIKDVLNENEKYYLQKSNLVYENKTIGIYSISKKQLFASSNNLEYSTFQKVKKDLISNDSYLVTHSNLQFKLYDFNDMPSNVTRNGKGAKIINFNGYSEIINFKENELKPNKAYTIRFWSYHGGPNYGQDQTHFSAFVQEQNGNQVKWISESISPMGSIEIDGDWSLIELHFKTGSSGSKYQLYISGDVQAKVPFVIDEVLVYEDGNTIYKEYTSKGNRYLFKNNHRIAIQ